MASIKLEQSLFVNRYNPFTKIGDVWFIQGVKSVWTVYIIQTKSGKLYTGITTDLKRRFKEHQNKSGAQFFHLSEAERIVYVELKANRSEATKREIEIKKMSRSQKDSLIRGCSSLLNP